VRCLTPSCKPPPTTTKALTMAPRHRKLTDMHVIPTSSKQLRRSSAVGCGASTHTIHPKSNDHNTYLVRKSLHNATNLGRRGAVGHKATLSHVVLAVLVAAVDHEAVCKSDNHLVLFVQFGSKSMQPFGAIANKSQRLAAGLQAWKGKTGVQSFSAVSHPPHTHQHLRSCGAGGVAPSALQSHRHACWQRLQASLAPLATTV
jgi:hypothetical protein